MSEIRLKCFSCGNEMTFAQIPGRREDCTKCGADVHVCRNCQHYDPKAYHECTEPLAEYVREKDRANFCDFFNPTPVGAVVSGIDRQKDLRAAADSLFKKKD